MWNPRLVLHPAIEALAEPLDPASRELLGMALLGVIDANVPRGLIDSWWYRANGRQPRGGLATLPVEGALADFAAARLSRWDEYTVGFACAVATARHRKGRFQRRARPSPGDLIDPFLACLAASVAFNRRFFERRPGWRRTGFGRWI